MNIRPQKSNSKEPKMYQSNIYQYLEELKTDKLLVCKDDKEAMQIRDVSVFLGFDTFVLPELRVEIGEDLRAYDEDIQSFLTTLRGYYDSKVKKVLVSPLRTLFLPFPRAELFDRQELEFGETLDFKRLKDTLYRWGYHFTDIASVRGEVSFRGDSIDIFRHRP